MMLVVVKLYWLCWWPDMWWLNDGGAGGAVTVVVLLLYVTVWQYLCNTQGLPQWFGRMPKLWEYSLRSRVQFPIG